MINIDVLVNEPRSPTRPDLERWIANDWVRPVVDRETFLFSDIDVARARLILELRDDLGVDETALPVVLLLLDQIYDLRRHLRSVARPVGPDAIDLRRLVFTPSGRCPDCRWTD